MHPSDRTKETQRSAQYRGIFFGGYDDLTILMERMYGTIP